MSSKGQEAAFRIKLRRFFSVKIVVVVLLALSCLIEHRFHIYLFLVFVCPVIIFSTSCHEHKGYGTLKEDKSGMKVKDRRLFLYRNESGDLFQIRQGTRTEAGQDIRKELVRH